MESFNWKALVLALLQLALLGGLTVAAVFNEVRPALELLAGAGGGWLASRVFAWVRSRKDLVAWIDSSGGVFTSYIKQAIAWIFFSPATAAATVFGLGVAISASAGFALAYFSGTPLNESWAALVAFVVSQVRFFIFHPDPLPEVPNASAANMPPLMTFTSMDDEQVARLSETLQNQTLVVVPKLDPNSTQVDLSGTARRAPAPAPDAPTDE